MRGSLWNIGEWAASGDHLGKEHELTSEKATSADSA
jgi:hypothetical protein